MQWRGWGLAVAWLGCGSGVAGVWECCGWGVAVVWLGCGSDIGFGDILSGKTA